MENTFLEFFCVLIHVKAAQGRIKHLIYSIYHIKMKEGQTIIIQISMNGYKDTKLQEEATFPFCPFPAIKHGSGLLPPEKLVNAVGDVEHFVENENKLPLLSFPFPLHGDLGYYSRKFFRILSVCIAVGEFQYVFGEQTLYCPPFPSSET